MFRIMAIWCLMLIVATPVTSGAKDMDGTPYTPGVDPDIDMYFGSWKESTPRNTHGALVERAILTRGDDPMNPRAKGAVLSHINRFSFATLAAHASTTPTILKGEQEIFYIMSGTGTIAAGGETAGLSPGIGILMPANLEFILHNTDDEQLTMYLVNEPIPAGFVPNKTMLVKDVTREKIMTPQWHWSMINHDLFNAGHGLGTIDNMLIVAFDPLTMGHPHIFFPECEEVWTAIKGTGDVWIGKQLRKQPPGTAYMLPPDGKITHSNINTTNEQIVMLYFIVYNKNITMDYATIEQPIDGTPYTPGVDPNIDMFMGNWKESMPHYTHGSLVERSILTKGNNVNPTNKGAVLTRINRYSYASLAAHCSTQPTTLKREQEIFYIDAGTGSIHAGGQTADLYRGIAVLMPADLEFTISNTGNESLAMYLINEPVPESFTPRTTMLVKDENTLPISGSKWHWAHIGKPLFSTSDGLGTIESMATIAFDPMTIAHPHTYIAGSEEVWTQISGSSVAWVGKQLRVQSPGTAYLVPADGKTTHANINNADEQVKMLYFLKTNRDAIQK